MRGEARISSGIWTMGGKGAFSSAIMRARSSLDTWRPRWSMTVTEEGLVVTRMGVRGPREGVGLGGIMRMESGCAVRCCAVQWRESRGGKGFVGQGVEAVERGRSRKVGRATSTAAPQGEGQPGNTVFFSIVWITDCLGTALVLVLPSRAGLDVCMLGQMFSRLDCWMLMEGWGNCVAEVSTMAWYSAWGVGDGTTMVGSRGPALKYFAGGVDRSADSKMTGQVGPGLADA